MNEIFNIPRKETIRKTAVLFGLPGHFFRTKASIGKVVAVRAERRFLVNVDKFAEYLSTSTIQPESGADPGNSAHITPISLKQAVRLWDL